jgi:hypothetical protein
MSFENGWRIALRTVRDQYPTVTFPDEWPYSEDIEPILTQKFWQDTENI